MRLQVADGSIFRETLAAHSGRVVLVDFWATWCLPCRKQFPHTVKLFRELGAKGLAVISVSLDEAEAEPATLAFLEESGANFDNLISRFGVSTRSAEEFGIRGDVPFYQLYDRTGRLRYQLSAEPDGLEHGQPLTELDQRVRELLAAR